jgi:hypothetical protein
MLPNVFTAKNDIDSYKEHLKSEISDALASPGTIQAGMNMNNIYSANYSRVNISASVSRVPTSNIL